MISLLLAAASPPPPKPTEWVWGMSPEAWLTIAAIILGPILALWIQRELDKYRERRGRRLWVFRELMITRGARLSQRHVEALNSISLEFDGEKKVIDAWEKYFDLFVSANPNPTSEAEIKTWLDKGDELLASLLYQISTIMRYKFSETDLKRKFYVPRAHGQVENEERVIRKGFFDIFSGTRKFPIDLWIPDEILEAFKKFAEEQQRLQQQAQAGQPASTQVTVLKASEAVTPLPTTKQEK